MVTIISMTAPQTGPITSWLPAPATVAGVNAPPTPLMAATRQIENQKPAQQPIRLGAIYFVFSHSQYITKLIVKAAMKAKPVRKTLLFFSGSVGSIIASQLSLKKTAIIRMKVATVMKTRMKVILILGPKQKRHRPVKIMTAPRTFSIGPMSSTGHPASCSRDIYIRQGSWSSSGATAYDLIFLGFLVTSSLQ